MFKVVFVDDETLVKLGLRSMLNWEEEGFEIEGEASNGKEGLELILKTKPDLVITDIIMPEMDGIKMMQQVKEQQLEPLFVFLSSYDQFELVKKAMKQGARDYLLKLKLNGEMLKEMLGNIKKELEKSTKNTEQRERSVWETEELKKVFLKRTLMGEELLLGDDIWDFGGEEKHIRLAYIVSNVHHLTGAKEEREKKIYLETIRNLIQDISREFFEAYCIEWEKNSFLIFLSEEGSQEETENLTLMAEAVIDMLMQYSNIQASIGLSGSVTGYENFKAAYMQAKMIQDFLPVEGYGKVIFFEDALMETESMKDGMAKDTFSVKKLSAICETLNTDELEQTAGELVEEIKKSGILMDRAAFYCIRFMCLLEEFLKVSWSNSYESGGLDVAIKKLYYSDTISEIIEIFNQYLEKVKGFFNRESDGEQKRIVREAKQYILSHIYNNISLEEIANALYISPGYLSSVFSKYEPMGAANYINKVKIEEAWQLLREQRLKVYEVAFQLGYENAGYFAKVFRKYTGCTPKEYMERK